MESVHVLHTTVQMHDLWINPLTHTHERFCCCKTAQLLQLMLMCSHVCSIWLLMLLNANAMLVLVPIFSFSLLLRHHTHTTKAESNAWGTQ